MNIRSTLRYSQNHKPTLTVPDFNESWSVPRWVSKPRSAISNADNLLQAADDLGWMQNPLPESARTAISTLGAGFAVANVSAELLDGDLRGALWDMGNSVTSLTTGARIIGLSEGGCRTMYAAGAVLNSVLAAEQLEAGETVEGCLRLGNVAGLALSVAGGLVGGPVGANLGSAGLALRGVVGFAGMAHDLTDKDGFLNRPDRFS